MNTDKYTERDFEEITGRFREVNIDRAWNNVRSRIGEEKLISETRKIGRMNNRFLFIGIAATFLLLIGLGAGFFFLRNSTGTGKSITVSSNSDQRDVTVTLPDGSKVWLNRNSKLKYNNNWGVSRNVKLTGEAYFEITPDHSKPFIIDAGKANVKVVGTSFNVITSNVDNNVEVYVRTGKVMLSDPSGVQTIMLEPGSVGTLGENGAENSINENRNYMAWKTDTLVYQGERLDVVFADLKRVFNINISTDDPEISKNSLTTTFFSQPEETIIKVICSSFSLRYEKTGSVYHLAR